MLRRIEVADAEREVDRVDVFEGGGQRDQVPGGHAERERGGDGQPYRPRRGGHDTGRRKSGAFRLPWR